MRPNITATVTAVVDVDLDDIDIEDIIDYVIEQGYEVYKDGINQQDYTVDTPESIRLIEQIYHNRRQGIAVEPLLQRLIYVVLGRIV